MASQTDPRNLSLAKIWAPTRALFGRSEADFIVHAHVLAEHGCESLTALNPKQLEAVGRWAQAVTNDDFGYT